MHPLQKAKHFNNVCCNKDKAKTITRDTHSTSNVCEGAVFNALGAITSFDQSHRKKRTTTPDHHLYNQLRDVWEKHVSAPQLFVTVTIWMTPEDFKNLRYKHIPIQSQSPNKHWLTLGVKAAWLVLKWSAAELEHR